MFNPAIRDQLSALGYRELCNHGNKQGHQSRGAAEAQLRSIRKVHVERGRPSYKDLSSLNVYYCYRCEQWFVGHSKYGKAAN
jgi:hypothetical protein